MDEHDALLHLPVSTWQGPFPAELRRRAQSTLESGGVLVFADLPFPVEPEEARFFSGGVSGGRRKNISFDHRSGRCSNIALSSQEAAGLAAMMDRYGRFAAELIVALIPSYAATLERARASLRTVEIQGRPTSTRHDDRLLHVDAFPSRPMHGRRILRVFSNAAPDGAPRVWNVGEPFADFAERFVPRVRPRLPGSAWLLNKIGITKGRRSAYDELMISLHDTVKRDYAYQSAAPRTTVAFPRGATWVCFTDQVLHAALAGHCAFEQTFHIPIEAMADSARAPLRVLETIAGRRLASATMARL